MPYRTYWVDVSEFGSDKKAATKAAKLLKDTLNIGGRTSYYHDNYDRVAIPTVIRVETDLNGWVGLIYEATKSSVEGIVDSKRFFRNEDNIFIGEL